MRRLREEDDENDDTPLHHRKPFGTGLKRKRVEFVRASEPSNETAAARGESAGSRISDIYASIVLSSTPAAMVARSDPTPACCKVCAVPITTSVAAHEASLAHQVKLPHAHPPSALDRSRMGLRALESQGWDPDARRGLGREGGGVRYPLKTVAKDDTLGVGASMPPAPTAAATARDAPSEPPPRTLTNKEIKEARARQRRKAERLQAEIYGRLDVEGYLHRKMDI